MAAIAFDTLKFVRRLRDAGFEEKQAESLADAFKEASSEADLASKRDLKDLELRLEARIDKLDTRLAGELTPIKWMLGMIIAAEVMPWVVKLFA
jgi:DNA-binding transcriptional MerR regulator